VGIVVLGIGCASRASAQTTFEGGVKAGVNVARVSGSVESDAKKGARIGGVFGGFVTMVLSDATSIQPEVLYSMEGVKVTAGSLVSNAKIDMLRIALLLRLGKRPAAGGGYVIFGPAVGIVMRARESFTGEADNDFKDQLKTSDAAIVVGAGYTMGRFVGEGRYMGGLTDLNNVSVGKAQTTQVVSILGGVRF
jgi:hypothetical protein